MRTHPYSILLVLLALVALALVPCAALAQSGVSAPGLQASGAVQHAGDGVAVDGMPILSYWIVSEVRGGHGAVSPRGFQSFYAGDTPTYYFMPDYGYHTEEVRVDGRCVRFTSYRDDFFTFPPVYENHKLSVEFEANTYVITPQAGPHGFVWPNTPQLVRYGSTPTFRFAPEPGYYASRITVDGYPVAGDAHNQYTFPPVMCDHYLRVFFTLVPGPAPLPTYVISPFVGGGMGSISPPTPQTVYKGATPTFLFAPLTGWHVAAVAVDGIPVTMTATDRYTFPSVQGNHALTVTFAQDTFTITASVTGTGGAINPSGAQTVAFGATPTFTFIPDAGYAVDTITVDGAVVSMSAPNAYTFSLVATNHTIAVSFKSIGGGGPPAGGVTVKAPYSASVKKGHTASLKYSVNQAVLGATADVTITIKNQAGAVVNTQIRTGVTLNTTHSCKVRCHFSRGTYTFTVSAVMASGPAASTASNTLTVR